jgi:RNA polymerase sigma factor (sigma-70 family)
VRARLFDLLERETAQKRLRPELPLSLPVGSPDAEVVTLLDLLGDMGGEPPDEAAARHGLGEALARALRPLPPDDRQIIDAWYQGRTTAEVAELLGKPRTTVSSRLAVILRRLRSDELEAFL